MEPDLRFQVLGPVRAWRAGQEIGVGARKQRAVLAALLLNIDQPLTAEEVVAFVWGDEAPPAAVGAVHTYVRGLRRALDPGRPAHSRGGVVSSGPSGYRLRVEPERVDHVRFGRLLEQGRRCWSAGRAEATVDTVTAALRLWGDRPLADLEPHLALNPRVVSLDQERLAAAALAADAALATGRAGESIPLLAQVIVRAPLHEPLQARLVEAYRRVGRRADALATYDRVRRGLRDELGIGPGPELRGAFQRVLDDDGRTARRLATSGAR